MVQIYLKKTPSLLKTLTNSFISPDFMCSGRKTMISGETNDSWIMVLMPNSNFLFVGHASLAQWFFSVVAVPKIKKDKDIFCK